MRSRFLFVLALAVYPALARAADEITWLRADGAPGWSAAIARDPVPVGTAVSPLLAPMWFAKFPDVKIPLAPTGTFASASTRGKVLLLDYWAAWCGPCLQELPHLQRLHLARVADGLVAVAVNADENAASAADSAKGLGLTMAIGVNEPDTYRSLGVRTLPTLLAVDKQGRLRKRWDGFRPGMEREIWNTVDDLLKDDPAGTTREMGSVIKGTGRLAARWMRDLPGTADGVVGLPGGATGGMRVVAAGGDEVLSFDAAGEALARLKAQSGLGRLRDFGAAADGTRELVGFRAGGTSVGVLELRSGNLRTITLPAPLLDLAVSGDGSGDGRRLVFATMAGAAQASPKDERALPKEGAAKVKSLAVQGRGILALKDDGAIGALDGSTPAWAHAVPGASRLLSAREEGAIVGPQSVVAAISGRFLRQEGRQLAVATYAGHLVLIDEASGRVDFDSVWSGIHDLGATDLDDDGFDELLVAAGRSVTALGAAGR